MSESKKVVIKLDVHDDCDKRKALKSVSGLSGVESLAMDMKDRKLTVIGDVDPVDVVGKLKKWHANIVTVGPAKEKDEKGEKKNEGKENEAEKEKEKKKKEEEEEAIKNLVEAYKAYNPYMTQRYCVHSVEEDPRGCVIC